MSNQITDEEYPKLVFPLGPDEEMEELLWYIEMKEYCSIAILTTEQGLRYSTNFITPRRLHQELRLSPHYIEPNLIIVSQTSLKSMQEAARIAWDTGFFQKSLPM